MSNAQIKKVFDVVGISLFYSRVSHKHLESVLSGDVILVTSVNEDDQRSHCYDSSFYLEIVDAYLDQAQKEIQVARKLLEPMKDPETNK